MKSNKPFWPAAIFLPYLLLFTFSCSKTNSDGTAQIYKNWTITHAYGSIAVNGNTIGVSEGNNTLGNITVQFQSSGNYNFKITGFIDETDGFTLIDSTIHLNTDSTYFANICAYPQLNFYNLPEQDGIFKAHVSPDLHIEYVSGDSLLLKTLQTKPGNNAPDTLYTEFTGLRRK